MKKTITLLLAAAAVLWAGWNVQAQDATLNKIRQARYVGAKPETAPLGILHYSDIHGDDIAVGKVKEALEKYGPYIDAVINTGDAVTYFATGTSEYPHDAKWWRATGLAEKSLFVLGNHDGAIGSDAKGHKERSADWDFYGKAWDFDTFFADYVKPLGYVMPEGYDNPASPYYKSCFWLKDYPEAKIRMIGIDGVHFNETFRYKTDEQEKWIAAKLAETLDPSKKCSGYSVILVCHYPLDDFEGDNESWAEASNRWIYNRSATGGRVMDHRTGDVTNFHTYSIGSWANDKRFSLRKKVASPSESYGYALDAVNPIGDIVQAWVDKGGKFVAWLCGHCHCDLMFYPAKYPDLLCIAADQAGNLRGNGYADRGEDLEARFCANYYVVDTQNGLFKIVRLGLGMDRFLVEKNVLCYDYLNKKVIFE